MSINDASFLIKGTQDNQLSFGINASKVDVHDLTLENILVLMMQKKTNIANGSVAASEANKKFTYKGLSLKRFL